MDRDDHEQKFEVKSWLEVSPQERKRTFGSYKEHEQRCVSQELAYQSKQKNVHKENTKPRRKLNEKAVQDLMSLIDDWNCDPFDQSYQDLRTLMSGQIASEKLTKDFESAHKDGEKILEKNFEERFFSKEKSIRFKSEKKDRKTFANPPEEDERTTGERSMENRVALKLINAYTNDSVERNIFEH